VIRSLNELRRHLALELHQKHGPKPIVAIIGEHHAYSWQPCSPLGNSAASSLLSIIIHTTIVTTASTNDTGDDDREGIVGVDAINNGRGSRHNLEPLVCFFFVSSTKLFFTARLRMTMRAQTVVWALTISFSFTITGKH
jgi:hypothetical protein